MLRNQPAMDSTGGGGYHITYVFAADDGAGIDDVAEEIFEVVAAGAGEFGADGSASAIEAVAVGASRVKERAALAEIGKSRLLAIPVKRVRRLGRKSGRSVICMLRRQIPGQSGLCTG